jgi:hypothetical protein
VQRHPRTSIFHTTEWLEALHRTYGYQPLAFTTSPTGSELRNGAAFCRVKSWLIRPRLVSLPFSDHADPLFDNEAELTELLEFLQQGQSDGKWNSVELRPPGTANSLNQWSGFYDGQKYLLHRLDLRPSLGELFRSLQKDSIQRKIRRAEREGLLYEEGRSETLLRMFYQLTVLTRRRKALPPPPLAWFQNVMKCLGEKAMIRIARKDDKAIAAILTLHHKQTMVYKYGSSDARFHNLGGMPFVLWKTIEDAKRHGVTEFDLGRSEASNAGLITFKERFGAIRSTLVYKRYPGHWELSDGAGWHVGIAKRLFKVLPDDLLVLAGRILYPHIG